MVKVKDSSYPLLRELQLFSMTTGRLWAWLLARGLSESPRLGWTRSGLSHPRLGPALAGSCVCPGWTMGCWTWPGLASCLRSGHAMDWLSCAGKHHRYHVACVILDSTKPLWVSHLVRNYQLSLFPCSS